MKFAVLFSSLAITAACQAAVVTYPAMNVSYTDDGTGNTDVTYTTGPVTLDPAAGVFLDPDQGSGSVAANRYYSGILNFSPNSSPDWGAGAVIRLYPSAGGPAIVFGKPSGSSTLRLGNDLVGALTPSVPFVIKVEDLGWNSSRVLVYIGSNATSATEGTADFTSPGDVYLPYTSSPLNRASFELSVAGWASGTASASLEQFSSSTTWNAVAVPEPGVIALLGTSALMVLRRSRAR